jgi:hypothetical protein
MGDGHRVILSRTGSRDLEERIITMAAPHSVDPVQLLEKHLASASPDLLAEMIAAFANAMMSAQAELLRRLELSAQRIRELETDNQRLRHALAEALTHHRTTASSTSSRT